MSPLVGELGKNTSITPALVSKKYPLPAVVFKVVEPSATVKACQSMCLTVAEPPNDTLDPFNVIELFANLALAIVPGAISAATTVPSSILSVVFSPLFLSTSFLAQKEE